MTGWTATVGSELLNSQTPSFPSMIIWFAASKCFIVAFCIPKKKKKLKTECVGCLQSISPCYQEIVEQGLPHNCTCVSAFERGVSSASPKSGSISHYAIWSFFDHMSHHWLLLFGSASISQAWMTQLALQFSPNTSSTSLGKPVQDEDISSTLAVFFTCFHKKKKKKKAQASKIKICRHKAVVFTLLLSKGAGRIKWWKFLVLVPCKARRSHSLCSILHLHYFRLETNYLTGHSLKKMTPWINCCEYNWWWDIKDANKSTQHIKVIMCSNSAL